MGIEGTVGKNRFDEDQQNDGKRKIDTVFDKLVLKYVPESGLYLMKQPSCGG